MLVIRNPRKSAKILHGRIYCLIKFPRVAPIKHALRQKAWRYAPFAAKTSLYRRPPVSAYGCILFWIPEFPNFRNPNSRNRIPPKSRGTTGIRGGMHRFSFGDFSLHYRAWRSLSQGLPNLSNLHAPYRGSFLKYAGIISSVLRLSSPVWVWLWAQYTIPPLSCQPFPANSKNFAVFHKSRSFTLYKSH